MKISRKVKDIAFVTFEIAMAVLTIGGLIWQDTADKAFWWNFWTYSPIVTFLAFVGGMWWKSKQRETPKQDQ